MKRYLFLFFAVKEGILKNPGNKFKPKGYTIDKVKLNNVSFIVCLPLYV